MGKQAHKANTMHYVLKLAECKDCISLCGVWMGAAGGWQLLDQAIAVRHIVGLGDSEKLQHGWADIY